MLQRTIVATASACDVLNSTIIENQAPPLLRWHPLVGCLRRLLSAVARSVVLSLALSLSLSLSLSLALSLSLSLSFIL